MDDITPENRIDLRELKLNTIWILFCYLAYIGPLDFMVLILLFHYLDWGWADRQFSPFSKLSRGLLTQARGEAHERPNAPHQKWARIHFMANLVLAGGIFLEIPWVFQLIAGGLMLLALLESMEQLSGKE
ncbi:MAG: hypothetical protein ACI9TH_002217 [Kiritimatiellia bacterium]|jgi:hypothetical protein